MKAIEILGKLSVLVECPRCQDQILMPNLTALDDMIQQMWKYSIGYARTEKEKAIWTKAAIAAGLKNKKEDAAKTILEKGYLTIMCRTCLTDRTQKIMIENGQAIQRRGNLLFDANFYVKNKKTIEAQIKADPSLTTRTFWT